MEEFVESPEWKRSKKGSLRRVYDGLTLPIFDRRDGFYGWLMADDEDVKFSRGGHDNEYEAIEALACEFQICVW